MQGKLKAILVSKKLLIFIGEILITLALVVALYVAYQLFYTNIESGYKSQTLASEFKEQILKKPATEAESVSQETPAVVRTFKKATVIGLMYIPRLKSDVWGEPIVAGTNYSELAQGIGHYQNNPLPGEPGNFAVAGHRVTYGQPFYYFEKLLQGDEVFVLRPDGWYSYQLVSNQKIQENEVWVLGNVQEQVGIAADQNMITLTTCDPRWNSTRRWAWWGVQTGYFPLDQTPPEIGGDF